MVIQHNISALNSHRQLGINNAATSKNLEKLSSGFKINRAGDDAAGLAISEKMRGQIRGLAMAEQNANNGISLIQTAEGGLNETHAILQRMRELAVQSSNGTYQDDVDRENLDKEVQALKEEITRISTSTHYNGINLLDGSLTAKEAGMADAALAGAVPTTIGTTLGTTQLGKQADLSDTKAKFEIDLSQYSVEVADYTNADDAVFTLTVGGEAIAVDLGADGTYTGGTLAAKVKTAADALNAGDGLEIGGIGYTVTVSGDKLVIEQTNLPSVDGATSTGNFTVAAATSVAGSASATPSGDINDGATVITSGHVPGERILANTSFTLSKDNMADGNKLTIGDKTYVFKAGKDSTTTAATGETLVDLTGIDSADTDYLKKAVDALTVAAADNGVFSVGQSTTAGQVTLLEKDANTVELDTLAKVQAQVKLQKPGTLSEADAKAKPLTFQIGANGGKDQRVSLAVGNMSAEGIGVDDVNVKSQEDANAAITVIDDAINQVSGTRADLGALQNRLEHTLNNLGVSKENLTAAESSIRDVDMAKEMMEFTKNNILVQASQAMLAQANQLPQGVLSLLR